MGIKKYRKLPLEITALRLDGLTRPSEAARWCGGTAINRGNGKAYIAITTDDGVHIAEEGDYIVKGIEGEFYTVKAGMFAKTYEEVK